VFINKSFDDIQSIEHSINLLRKFEHILKRDNLKQELLAKYTIIFHNYGLEMGQIIDQYERQKDKPPLVRNMPQVSGSILWASHLLKRVIIPMKNFPEWLITSKESKKFIKTYNKIGQKLTEYQVNFHYEWCN